jgi:tetratricopeptide (TPR) repeat protein
LRCAAVALCVLLGGVAYATPPGDNAEARTYYREGSLRYQHGDYAGAVDEFQRGYHLVPLPDFLFDMARAYERMDDLAHAKTSYERFLAEAPPDDPYRPRAQAALAELTRRLSTPRPDEPRPVPAPATPKSGPQTAPAAGVSPLTVAMPSVQAPPKRRYLRWLIPVLSIVVVGTAAAVTGALVTSAQHKDSCASAALGCLPLGP